MKRRFLLIILAVLLLNFSACGIPEGGWEQEDSIQYPMKGCFAESATRILYYGGGILQYYNKIENELSRFCFDPLCEHRDFNVCIAQRFQNADGYFQSIEYCAYDNRFYALRGQKLCSFAFDGSDLRIEYSFGESGAFDEYMYSSSGLNCLSVTGQYVYMLVKNSESGKKEFVRYDVEAKKMDIMFYDEETGIVGYVIYEDSIYIVLTGTLFSGLYQADFSFSEMTLIVRDLYIDPMGIIPANDCFYFVDDGSIVRYDLNTNTRQVLLEYEESSMCELKAITKDGIYYTLREPVSIGYYIFKNEADEQFNYRSKIYYWDFEEETHTVVFDNVECEVQSLCFFEDNVLIQGNLCKISDTVAMKNSALFVAEFNHNGVWGTITCLDHP